MRGQRLLSEGEAQGSGEPPVETTVDVLEEPAAPKEAAPEPDPFDFDEPNYTPAAADDDTGGDRDATDDTGEGDTAIPAALASRAEQLGVPQADIDAFKGHPELFGRYLETFKKPAATGDGDDDTEGDGDADETFKVTLDPDVYEESLIQQFEAMKSHFEGRLKAQSTELAELRSVRDDEVNAATLSRFDTYLEGLGKDWKSVFGEGKTDALPRGSKAFLARSAVWEEARRMQAGYEATGAEPPSESELLSRALKVAHSDHHTTITRAQLRKSVASREKRITNRPSQTAGKELTGEAAAIRNVAALMEERGMLNDEDKNMLDPSVASAAAARV